MIIAYGSDLHIEFGTKGLIDRLSETDADVLVLAGDIATTDDYDKMHNPDTIQRRKDLKAFFDLANEKFEHTVVIMGNHEYYGGEVSRTPEKIRKSLSIYDNVTLLENEVKVIRDVVFFGSTMWTEMEENNPVLRHQIHFGLNDFKRIRYKTNGNYSKFTPSIASALHRKAMNALSDALDEYPDTKFVAVHHHAPAFKSVDPIYATSKLNGAYFSHELETKIMTGGFSRLPDVLIHGHMHSKSNYKLRTMDVLANPRGYQGHEASADRFKFEVEAI